jgi:hypothetical protein
MSSTSKQREAVERAKRIAEERAKSLREERARMAAATAAATSTTSMNGNNISTNQQQYSNQLTHHFQQQPPKQQQQQQYPYYQQLEPQPAPPPPPTSWPDSLKRWLERSLQQTQHDAQLNKLMQEKLKLEVQLAVEHNVIWVTDWDAIPPLAIPVESDPMIAVVPPPPPPQQHLPQTTPNPTNAQISTNNPYYQVPSVFNDPEPIIPNNNNNTFHNQQHQGSSYYFGYDDQSSTIPTQQQPPFGDHLIFPSTTISTKPTSSNTNNKSDTANNKKKSDKKRSTTTTTKSSIPPITSSANSIPITKKPIITDSNTIETESKKIERANRFASSSSSNTYNINTTGSQDNYYPFATSSTGTTISPPIDERSLTGTERTFLAAERVAKARKEAELRGEELDLSTFIVQGTSEALEKPYLRLTSAPDPSTIRPQHILEKSLQHVRKRLAENGSTVYDWASEQFRSIRQDITVQHIKNDLTLDAYETHARSAILFGGPDFREFNQCVTQLLELFDQGMGTIELKREFRAYTLLYHIFTLHSFKTVASAITLSSAIPESEEEYHALKVWEAVETGDWIRYFKLREIAPNMGKHFMGDPLAGIVRKNALCSLCRSFRPSLPLMFVKESLGFIVAGGGGGGNTNNSTTNKSGFLIGNEELSWINLKSNKLVMMNDELIDTKATLQLNI